MNNCNDTHPVGELLVKLCELSRSHNVDIRCRQDSFNPNGFVIQLDRRDNHAATSFDTTRTFISEPEEVAEFAFRRALYDINHLEKKTEVSNHE